MDAATSFKKRKQIYTTRACNGCRRRKIKCDGGTPSCEVCTGRMDECHYSDHVDHRKAIPKSYVTALENQVQNLHAQIAILSSGQPHPDDKRGEESMVGQFKIDSGQITYYGPTSAYMHLPDVFPSTSRDQAAKESLSENYDWARHLPHLAGMTKQGHDEVLNLAFDYIGHFCRYIDAEAFFADMRASLSYPTASVPQRRQHYSPFLHNAVLAVGSRYSDFDWVRASTDSEVSSTSEAGSAFARCASRYVDEEADQPLLSTVRGMVLLTVFHWGCARQSLSWMYSGMATRTAQSLGLNMDCTALVRRGMLDSTIAVERDETFFLVFVQDKLASLTYGRASALGRRDFTTPLPSVSQARDAELWPGEHNQRHGHVAGHTSTVFHWICVVILLAEEVRTTIYGVGSSVRTEMASRKRAQIWVEIESLDTRLPPEIAIGPSPRHDRLVSPSVIVLHCLLNHLKILLLRPAYASLGSSNDNSAVKSGNMAAARIVTLLRLFDFTIGLRFGPPCLVQIAYGAGTIHLLAAVQPRQEGSKVSNSIAGIRYCLSFLEIMGNSWRPATQACSILRDMAQEWLPDADVGSTSSGTARNDTEVGLESVPSVGLRFEPGFTGDALDPFAAISANTLLPFANFGDLLGDFVTTEQQLPWSAGMDDSWVGPDRL